MSVAIINGYVFGKMENDLTQLSAALDHLALLVCQIGADVPEDIKGRVEEALEKRMNGIHSIINCLSTMACGLSDSAADWRCWANKNDILIEHRI